MDYKPFIVLPTVLLLILSFTVVCSQPPPAVPTRAPLLHPPRSPTLPPQPTRTISQKETAIAQRSVEIFAKQTTTAQLRSTAPIATPTLIPTTAPRSSGLGVSRRALRSIYEDDLRILCHGGSPIAGYSRGFETWRCTSSLGSPVGMKVEIVGPLWDDEVVFVRLTVYDPHDNGQATALHVALFLQSTVPGWAESLEWVDDNMLEAVDGDVRTATHGDTDLTLQWLRGTRVEFILEVETQ